MRAGRLAPKDPRRAAAGVVAVAVAALAGAASTATPPGPMPFRNASATLPVKSGIGHSMGAEAADVDGDGDLDLLVAMEREPNRLLLNDGRGRFVDASERLPRAARDSEDVAVADFDGDGDLDVAVANEDDLEPELYLNAGGARFVDASERLRVRVKANAVVVVDPDRNGRPDLFFGGDKVSVLFMNQGGARFRDESRERLPATYGGTQHVAVADLDRDGLQDLVLGNEDRNQVYLGTAAGGFALAPPGTLPPPPGPEETRDVEVLDANGDGAPDLLLANVRVFDPTRVPRSRLLLNDGQGRFTDASAAWLSPREESTFNAAAIDLDRDGRIDLVTSGIEDLGGRRSFGPLRAWRNEGGTFREITALVIPRDAGANGFDLVPADFDGDGLMDLFVASRGGPDQLLLTRPAPGAASKGGT